MINKVAVQKQARLVVDNAWEDGPHPLYEIEHQDQRVAFYHPGAAALLAVAQFRQVKLGQILYAGDDLSGETWDNRSWQSRSEVRENLFWLAVEASLNL